MCILLNFIFSILHKIQIILKENFVKNAEFYFIFGSLYKNKGRYLYKSLNFNFVRLHKK